MTVSIDKLPTAVPGLDTLTRGGIPESRATLIVGRSGTGKTVLGLQLATHLARQGRNVILFGVEESVADLTTTAQALGLNAEGLIEHGALTMVDLMPPLEGPTVVSGEYDLQGLVQRVSQSVKSRKADVVVLDSVTALFSPRPPQHLLRNHFLLLLHAFRTLGVTTILLAEGAAQLNELTTLNIEDYLCDLVIILRNNVDGDRRRRSLEIHKYRRSAHYKGEYPCTITTKGLAIFPLDAPDRSESEELERYSSGLEGLDEMTNGGWLRNAIMLVRGPTGSGKTMLAGLYARAGAMRHERVVYYGFEEPRPILLRNFKQIGMDMQPAIESGALRVECRYPEATSLEDLLINLRVGLEEFKPTLVVFDSISSIEHASSEKAFRQFMIGLASLLREHGRSALLTQTVASGESTDHSAPYLSTVADAILAMDYAPRGFELNRTLRLIKMRGSAHDTHPYELIIESGGLRVNRVAGPKPHPARGDRT
jgi:circadian clock protein KaiC